MLGKAVTGLRYNTNGVDSRIIARGVIMAGKFELKKGKTGKFSFNLKSGNGQVVFTSQTYDDKRSANAGIKSVVSGAITHTPDANFLLGPAPGPANYWMSWSRCFRKRRK